VLDVDEEEFRSLNNSLNWLCNGLVDLTDKQFRELLGASKKDAEALLDLIHGSRSAAAASTRIAVRNQELALLGRVLWAMVQGPAALPGAQVDRHDFALIGVDGPRFRRVIEDLDAVMRGIETD
jgi:hypothetical protein